MEPDPFQTPQCEATSGLITKSGLALSRKSRLLFARSRLPNSVWAKIFGVGPTVDCFIGTFVTDDSISGKVTAVRIVYLQFTVFRNVS